MACDGTIAEEEIQVLQQASKDFAFEGDLSRYLSEWIDLLGVQGASFFEAYFQELRSEVVSSPQAINLLGLMIKIIEADRDITYAEIKFFKSVRNLLPIKDDEILSAYPGREELLLPDISDRSAFIWKEDLIIPDQMDKFFLKAE